MAATKRIGPKKLSRIAANRNRNREIYQRWINGETQRELAAAYKISQSVIRDACRQTESQLTIELSAEASTIKARHMARLENAYAEAIRAWNGSEKQPEDSKHLQTALKALASIERVAGITKVESTNNIQTNNIQINGDLRLNNPDAERAELLGIIAAAAERAREAEGESVIDAHPNPESGVQEEPEN